LGNRRRLLFLGESLAGQQLGADTDDEGEGEPKQGEAENFTERVLSNQEAPVGKESSWKLVLLYLYIYIYISIYTRFAYGSLRSLWIRTKQSSMQWSVSDCEMSKVELRTVH